MCLQLAENGCLLPGVLQGKWADMVSPGQRARPAIQQGLALFRYYLALCPSTAAYLQMEARLSTAACTISQSCDAYGRYFMLLQA